MITARDARAAAAPAAALWDVERVRKDFPALHQRVHGKPLVYLDNAATSQKPQAVIDALVAYYSLENSNVHRGVHLLSEKATQAYEEARVRVQRFLNAADAREIVFVRGATEGINLVAASYGRTWIGAGDEVIISTIEHHSNIVPWQLLCEERGALLRVIPVDDAGELLLDEYARLLGARTKLVAVSHISNALGTVNPVKRMIEMAHRQGVPVLIDGAQATPHLRVDVRELDCDFYVFSGHKALGPTGIGVLYGRAEWLERMPPYQGGGDMIASVTFEKTTFNALPYKFEAGTPHIAGVIGLGVALEYLSGLGLDRVAAYERELLTYGTATLQAAPGVRIIGTAPDKASVLSFIVDGVHAHDVGTILDHAGIAVRAGHHCAMPVMRWTRSAPGFARCGRSSGDVRAARAVPAGHPRPQPEAPQLWEARRGQPDGGGLQPPLRGPGPGLPRHRGGRDPRHPLRGLGLRHLQGGGLDDDGEPQGQDRRRGRPALRPVPRYADGGGERRRRRRAGKARGLLRSVRVPEPNQVRDPALAHGARRARRQGRAGLDRVGEPTR